jgi:CelD/BcsL family acetyltransferase involved in cellulose biosynthesis
MESSTNLLLDVAVVEDSRAFMALKEEWEDLYWNSPLATPFQSWAWLYSWWEFYGEDYELRLITVWDEGLLVGVIPLMLERRWGFGRLLFVGTDLTDYLDILVRRGWEKEVSTAGRHALQQIDSWQVVDLQQLRPAAAAWSLSQKWPGPRIHVWQSGCPVIAVKPWDELVASLSRNLRSDVRRTLRRAEADGVVRKLASAEDAKQAAYRCINLHRETWRGRYITPEHLTARFESHIVTAAVRLTARGLGGISEFWQDGKVIASDFLLFGHDFVGGYMTGANHKALQRYQLSSLNIWDAVNIARSRNSAFVNLLRGEELHKLRWNPRVVPNHRAILGRSLVFWGPYAGHHALRSEIRCALAHRESLPRWVKVLAGGYRTLRYKAAEYVNGAESS